MPDADDRARRYIQAQLPLAISPLLRAAWPCGRCCGVLTVRRRRFVCGDCGYSEAISEATKARLAGAAELPLFEEGSTDAGQG